jgi:predicted ribosomally synthesized peptide with SipW-like signal peptide
MGKQRSSIRRDRVFALAAAGVVLVGGIGAASFAAWNDIEWITGDAGADGPITTSVFEVEQFAAGDTVWDHYETEAGANAVNFGPQSAALTPGDTVYAWVSLRTVADSLGGELTLRGDTVITPAEITEAVTYGARMVADAATCTAVGFAASTDVIVISGAALDDDATELITLAAAPNDTTPGAEQTVCIAIDFALSFADDDALQGQVLTPVWHFDAVSIP